MLSHRHRWSEWRTKQTPLPLTLLRPSVLGTRLPQYYRNVWRPWEWGTGLGWWSIFAKSYSREDDLWYADLKSPLLHYPQLKHGILELLPPDVTCSKETRDLVIECCVGASPYTSSFSNNSFWPSVSEFIHLISSEANEICEQDSKKTIAPNHIIDALKVRI